MNNSENEKSAVRGRALARMGLVDKEKDGKRWEVKTPYLSGHQRSFFVNTGKKTSACTCLEYDAANNREFMCEHKWAVYYTVLTNIEAENAAKKPHSDGLDSSRA